ncbi:MAG: hypothetical protein ACI9J2_002070 [Saprospiraceae bacterium]|jgi:hypothetical protein
MEATIRQVFDTYPDHIRQPLSLVRSAVFEVAQSLDIELTETLKWGQPGYLTGSTLRLGWSPRAPNECALYFHCQSSLVESFREIYRGVFGFQGNRVVTFKAAGELPMREIKGRISLARRYHQIKHLLMLGA